jgi:hypothetical protein
MRGKNKMETLNNQLIQLHEIIINKSNELPLLFQSGRDDDAITLCNEINELNDLYNSIKPIYDLMVKMNELNN